MKVKMCVNNLDLFTSPTNENQVIRELLQENRIPNRGFELEEVHCLGYCHWCHCGPTAVVENIFIHKDVN